MLNIIYAGSPEASLETLKILFENQTQYDYKIVGVISNPPTAKGRHKELTPTFVAQFAIDNNIPLLTPQHLDSECRVEVKKLNPDLLVCFAYGHIFGPKFLDLFKYGGINLHPSLLPKYRGCTPVPAAILNRDTKTAVTIQTLSLKMDEGEILAQKEIQLDFSETSESLLNQSAQIGANLIINVIKEIITDKKLPQGVSQSGDSSYTNIITKDDARINWNDSVQKIEAMVRAYFPEPGCWTLENGLPLRILSSKYIPLEDSSVIKYKDETNGTVVAFEKQNGIFIKANDGILCVLSLQRQGKKIMNYKDFMNGARDFVGTKLQ